jgi:hypothetical protein
MKAQLTVDTFLVWLAENGQRCAKTTLTGAYLHDALWDVALDAASWLRSIPIQEREKVLQTARECLNTGSAGNVAIPADQREADCFVTLLRWVVNPPPVL